MRYIAIYLITFIITSCSNIRNSHNTLHNQIEKINYYNIGKSYYLHFSDEKSMLKRFDTAASYFRKIVDTTKTHPLSDYERNAFFWLAGIYNTKGDYPKLYSLCEVIGRLYKNDYLNDWVSSYFNKDSPYFINQDLKEQYPTLDSLLYVHTKGKFYRERKILENIYDNDQRFRKMLLIHKSPSDGVLRNIDDSLRRTDSSNLQIVSKIIKKFGWLGPKEIGAKANSALFLVIQHSPPTTLLKYYSIIKKAYKKEHISKEDYALYRDRVAVYKYGYQLYGTQSYFNEDSKSWKLYPLKDSLNINMLRKNIGLDSMK